MTIAAIVGLFIVTQALPDASGQSFRFPTANRTLLENGGEDRFFVGTIGRPWTSGMFGCVRSEGRQFHEGIDIRCLERDRQREPIDPVLATADGTVVYANHKPGLSNYGRYLVLKHQIEGLEIYSTYAHLREIARGIEPGRMVRAGEAIGILGRSTNTREGISKERAHVHFEINFFVNDRFVSWYEKNLSGQRNDHGLWNGFNLLGLDPREVLLRQAEEGSKFSLLNFVRNQTELCRVIVRSTDFPWLRRYVTLIRRNLVAEAEGVAGYEIALNYAGVPFQLVPRAPSEIPDGAKLQLLSVNEDESQKHPCRQVVVRKGGRWQLGQRGVQLIELLTH